MKRPTYTEREDALQWVVVGMCIASKSIADDMDRNQFAGRFTEIVDAICNREWSRGASFWIAERLGVVKQSEDETLTEAIMRTLQEDARARRAVPHSQHAIGPPGYPRWDRLNKVNGHLKELQ